MNELKKSIPTVYGTTTFRSRTEAKYAVLFDKLGIEYEYEPEGFELSDGTKYLPDFYIPAWDQWLEVKGHMGDYDQHKVDMFEHDFGYDLIIGHPNFKMTLSDLETEMFITLDGFIDEPIDFELFREAVDEAKNYNFGIPVVEKKDVVDDDSLARLIDLKATYLNDYYQLQSSYPRIKNQVYDTTSGEYRFTPYIIYITAGQREDFTITLTKQDREVFHIAVKENEVYEACKKVFRAAYELHQDDIKSSGRHHDEIVDGKLNDLTSWLYAERMN